MELEEYKKMDAIENNHWWFVAKRKFLDIILKKYAQGEKLKILDLGCGTGAVMKHIDNKGHEIFGVDANDSALDYCLQKSLQVQKGEAEKINFPDSTFDIVVALDLLEHLEIPANAMQEIKRILKPNGLLIATVPAHQFLWSYHDTSLHHKKRYSKKDFKELIGSALSPELITWLHSSILLPAILVRLIKKSGGTSDVKNSHTLINTIMKSVYFFEITIFKLFNYLPWGLSLLIVARKHDSTT